MKEIKVYVEGYRNEEFVKSVMKKKIEECEIKYWDRRRHQPNASDSYGYCLDYIIDNEKKYEYHHTATTISYISYSNLWELMDDCIKYRVNIELFNLCQPNSNTEVFYTLVVSEETINDFEAYRRIVRLNNEE